jgi:hypothetical protein
MHQKGPLHVDAFATWCIRGVTHCNAFRCSLNSCILVHSDYVAFICIIVHFQCVAFYMSCIQMHLYASPHKVHSVDTLHSDSHSYAFKCIQMHSLTHAFTCVRRCIHIQVWRWRLGWHVVAHGCSYGTPYGTPTARPAHIRCVHMWVWPWVRSASLLCIKYVCVVPGCILVHSDAFLCIHVHSCAFLSIMKRVRSLIEIGHFSSYCKCTGIHNNASECITDRMQHIQNAPSWECIEMR